MTRCITDLTCANVEGMDDGKNDAGATARPTGTLPRDEALLHAGNKRAAQAVARRPAAYTPMKASTFAAATRFSETSRSGSTPASP